MIDVLPIVMLAALAVLLFSGLPVAVLLAGIGVLFSLVGVAIGEMPAAALYNIPLRMFGSIRGGLIFPAVVMLLFMGVALEKSGVARDMLLCLKMLLRRVPNGLAVAVILLGVLLAPAAGLVGASVVTLALIALPTMLAQGYRASVATGSVAAAGTVGIILPPAVMLFFLAGQFGVSIGHMLMATVVPGAILIGLYLAYYIISGMIRPPAAATEEDPYPATMRALSGFIVRGLVMPFGLVALVLASIIFAWATPSQAGAVGAAGGVVLLILNRRLNWTIFLSVVQTTALLAAMVFFIIMAAAVFSYPFRYFGGDSVIAEALASLDFGPWGALLLIAGIIFILGFFHRLDRDHRDHAAFVHAGADRARFLQPCGRRSRGDALDGDHRSLDIANLVPDAAFRFRALLPQGRRAARRWPGRHLSRHRADRDGADRRHRPAACVSENRHLVAAAHLRIAKANNTIRRPGIAEGGW